MESLALPRNKDFLESVLKEISGRDWNLKYSLKEGLTVAEPKHEASEEVAQSSKKTQDAETFKDDPLIREALEIFKGQIKT